MDIAWDELNRDMALGPEGDIFWVREDAAVEQHLRFRLRFFLGEWFLDIREGVPYFEKIFRKLSSLITPKSIFRRVITETPGIAVLNRLNLRFDAPERCLSVDFEARTTGGGRVASEFELPFIPLEDDK